MSCATKTKAFALATAITLALLGGDALAHGADSTSTPMLVQSSQLLGNGSGWVSDGGQVFFTRNDGATWRDITPAGLAGGIQQVDFVNPTTGWIVTSDARHDDRLHVVATIDAGTTWNRVGSILVPRDLQGARVSSASFADARNGWIMLTASSNDSSDGNVLYHTANAGRSWQMMPTPPAAGTIDFVSATTGRLNAVEGYVDHWQTQDGGLSWWPSDGVAWTPDKLASATDLLGKALTADEALVDVHYAATGNGWALALGGFCEIESSCVQYTRLLSFDTTGQSVDITPEVRASSIAYAPRMSGLETSAKSGFAGKIGRHANFELGAVPKALPNVSLIHVVLQAQIEPTQGNQPAFGDEYVKDVQRALGANGISISVNGIFGTNTRTAYSTWQRRLGYSGLDASGTPGPTSLIKLGQNRFVVGGRFSIGNRVSFRGVTVNERTKAMVLGAERILGTTHYLSQGSYNPGGVDASAGTHDGGGTVDIPTSGWSQTRKWTTVKALRQVGFAAWYRPTGPKWDQHIHAIAIGDYDIAPGGNYQIGDYLVGRDGLMYHQPDNTPEAYRVPFTWWERTPYYRPF